MAYASLEDVTDRIPTQIWQPNASSQPTAERVEAWLDELSLWLDSTFAWRYQTPITNDGDLLLLRPICAMLVAARVWGVKGGFRADQMPAGGDLRREALQMLAYNAQTGRSNLALASAPYSEVREAALSVPASSFSDPDVCGNERWFDVRMDF